MEYAIPGFIRLLADFGNAFDPRFLRMVWQIWRFQIEARDILEDRRYEGWSIADFVTDKGYGGDFLHKFLVPLISGLWSISPQGMMGYPATTLVEFLKNHEFLQRSMYFLNRWRTVVGGSASYTSRIAALFRERIHLNRAVESVLRHNGKVVVIDRRGDRATFDHAILACHADQALALLAKPTSEETKVLSKFKYAPTRVVLHTDRSVMPKRQRAWSSWNYLVDCDHGEQLAACFTYYMNMVQSLPSKRDYFVTVNDGGRIDPRRILREFNYEHPLFDYQAIQAQSELSELNKNGQVYFAGSYFKYGFHEDAFRSGIEVCRLITGENIWE
jgi:predicted NAD/FAD-binding protein